MGWDLNRIKTSKSRTETSMKHGKHMMIFRDKTGVSVPDPRNTNKPMFFEIIATNSSDGRSALKFDAGIFTLVCSNGLTIKSHNLGSLYQSHVNINFDNLNEMLGRFQQFVNYGVERVNLFSQKQISTQQAIDMASFVAKARFGDNPTEKINPNELIMHRREDDLGNTVWTYMNVIQENLIRGGVLNRSNRRVRSLSNMNVSNKVNDYVWEAAEQMLEV